MRRTDREIVDRETIDSILNEAEVSRIGMSNENIPYVVAVNFGYDGENIYFHSANEGKKIDILKKNKVVCFEVEARTEIIKSEVACRWGMRYLSVIGMGKAEFIGELALKKKALNIIMGKYAKGINFDYTETELNKIEVIKIAITEITGKKSGY